MRRVGIGGVQNFDGSFGIQPIVKKRIAYFVPGALMLLDLGRVGDIAEVRMNGRAMGRSGTPRFVSISAPRSSLMTMNWKFVSLISGSIG